MEFVVPGSETNAVIGELNPLCSYQVYVRGTNSAGDGLYSNIPVIAKSN